MYESPYMYVKSHEMDLPVGLKDLQRYHRHERGRSNQIQIKQPLNSWYTKKSKKVTSIENLSFMNTNTKVILVWVN